ncbi:hypothetical protein [Legionella sp. CNM-4043-24]|uniref:hypothetical protein n=1 Tax=Legionella sp. CNM-4043-24 TaxID=3421646 RepID=UPI00403B1F2F
MSAFFQNILASVISVIFSKWLDRVYPGKELSKEFLHTLHIKSEANLAISTKKTLSEQINDRIFLSKGAYYIVTIMMLYAFLTLAYMFLCASETYLNHPLQQNALSDFIRDLGENINELHSVVIAFLIYPFINFFSRGPFKLIISALKGMNFTFTEMNVQQIRMGTCVSLSALLVLGIIYYVF